MAHDNPDPNYDDIRSDADSKDGDGEGEGDDNRSRDAAETCCTAVQCRRISLALPKSQLQTYVGLSPQIVSRPLMWGGIIIPTSALVDTQVWRQERRMHLTSVHRLSDDGFLSDLCLLLSGRGWRKLCRNLLHGRP